MSALGAILGNQYKIYIEDKVGNVQEISGLVRRMDVNIGYDLIDITPHDHYDVLNSGFIKSAKTSGSVTIEMSLTDSSSVFTSSHDEIIQRTKAEEWKCDFCG